MQMRCLTGLAALILAGGFTIHAQRATPSTDVLGAHMNYGRGCSACHAPHSGSAGNGQSAPVAGSSIAGKILWGEDVSGLYGKTITTGGGKYVELLPSSLSATTPDVNGMLTCLGCHDGNYAGSSMMKNKLYETVGPGYGHANSIPTLLGNSGGNMMNDHPAGLSAAISCGGATGWDCSVSASGEVRMTGMHARQFVSNYGFFVKPGSYNSSAVVVCTTCHDPHVMNVVTINSGSQSGLPPGTYATMYFLRAPYNPNDSNQASNQTAQFCRQCHADKSNEMNGSTAGTVF